MNKRNQLCNAAHAHSLPHELTGLAFSLRAFSRGDADLTFVAEQLLQHRNELTHYYGPTLVGPVLELALAYTKGAHR